MNEVIAASQIVTDKDIKPIPPNKMIIKDIKISSTIEDMNLSKALSIITPIAKSIIFHLAIKSLKLSKCFLAASVTFLFPFFAI